jgi:GTP cyclohydrolase IB
LSRFLEALDCVAGELTIQTARSLLERVRADQGATTARVIADFPYLIRKTAPVSGVPGLLDVEVRFDFRTSHDDLSFAMTVVVPVTTLCPCSQAVSDYGAHNQRTYVTMAVALASDSAGDDLLWIEDLVELAERSASAPIYPTLKREDERFVTMQAFDNPAFVEDVVRSVAVGLTEDNRVERFFVRVASEESIHNHQAFAEVGRPLH